MNQIDLKRIVEDLVGLEEVTASQEVDIVDDQDNDPKKTSVTFDDVDRESIKYIKNDKHDSSRAAQ